MRPRTIDWSGDNPTAARLRTIHANWPRGLMSDFRSGETERDETREAVERVLRERFSLAWSEMAPEQRAEHYRGTAADILDLSQEPSELRALQRECQRIVDNGESWARQYAHRVLERALARITTPQESGSKSVQQKSVRRRL